MCVLVTDRQDSTMFDIEWLGRRVALRANNGKYVCTKKNGQLAAVSNSLGEWKHVIFWLLAHYYWPVTTEYPLNMSRINPCMCSAGEDEQFVLKLINRPILVLRGENGFVCHHKTSNTLDCNRSVYDIFSLLFSDGAYQIKSESYCYCVSCNLQGFHWAAHTPLGTFLQTPDECMYMSFFFLPQVEMKSSGMSPAVVWCAQMETNLRSSSLSLRSMDGLASRVKITNTCGETREAHWWATGSVWMPRPCGSTECCTKDPQRHKYRFTK